MTADRPYQDLLRTLQTRGDRLVTRNAPVYSVVDYPRLVFTSFPLVTLRRTAWKKALREMEWFLSGDPVCPEVLKDWWAGQLAADGEYKAGYGAQWHREGYDQIEALYTTLRDHPHSRRAIATTWHSADMAQITEINQNPHTPTTCHGTVLQGWVRNQQLVLATYQRSADVLLGVPHNWVQYWALGVWLATRLGLTMGKLIWDFGDLHLYDEPSHLQAAQEIQAGPGDRPPLTLVYEGPKDTFVAEHFAIVGTVGEPVCRLRPKLL
jgi:thymidylate synthase